MPKTKRIDEKGLIKYLGSRAVVARNYHNPEESITYLEGEITYHFPNFQIYEDGERENLQKEDVIKICSSRGRNLYYKYEPQTL